MTTESGIVLHRIECVNAFSNVKVGEKGGFVEKEENLSQYNNCWVYENARVHGDACVFGNARVYGDARVYENARVFGNSRVHGDALVCGDARVFGNSVVCGDACVFRNSRVFGNSRVCENARVYGEARVCENAVVCGDAILCGDAIIKNGNDYIVFKNKWSSGRDFTWTRSNDMWKVGCFYGTGKELIEKAYKDSKLSGDCYKAYVELVDKLKEIQN